MCSSDLIDLHVHDSHYWSSVVGAKALSRAAYDALVELYPNEKDKWDKGHDRLNGRIDSVKRLVDTMFANGKADKAFVIYHPSLSFFAQEFGLRQIVIEEDGKETIPLVRNPSNAIKTLPLIRLLLKK